MYDISSLYNIGFVFSFDVSCHLHYWHLVYTYTHLMAMSQRHAIHYLYQTDCPVSATNSLVQPIDYGLVVDIY